MSKTDEPISNKPKNLILDHYHCTLFLPLIGLEQKKANFNVNSDYRHYYTFKADDKEEDASYYYFSPTIREILYDKGNKKGAIKEWRLPDKIINNWIIQLDNSRASIYSSVKRDQFAQVRSVRLLQYFNDIYLLALRLEPTALIKLKAQKNDAFKNIIKNSLQSYGVKYSETPQLYQQLIMEDWMHFTRLIRLLYPSFDQQILEHKIAPIHLLYKGEKDNKVKKITAFSEDFSKKGLNKSKIPFHSIGEDFSPVICEFIKAFAKEPSLVKKQIKKYVKFYDDRMFVSVAYSIAGKQLPKQDLERINTLVSYVDRQEADGWDILKGYAYTPEDITEKIKKQSFSLWEGLGGYYSFTDFSNSYLNRGDDFRSFIANEHIPHIYDRMLIQALFYQSTLRHYDNVICDSTNKLLEEKLDINDIKKQRGDFIKFTNQYWFHKLTEQMQGKEIFALQQKALGLKEHYEILKDELERTDEYLQAEHDIKESKFNTNIARFGLLFAILALYYTVLPILNTAFSSKANTLWQIIGCRAGFNDLENAQIAGIIIMLILVPAIFTPISYMIYKLFKAHNSSVEGRISPK